MSPAELKNWLDLISAAPGGWHNATVNVFWALVILLMLRPALKVLSSPEFRALYRLGGRFNEVVARGALRAVRSAAKCLDLPEPYPRVAKFFSILFMINSYASAVVFACLCLYIVAAIVMSPGAGFWRHQLGLLFFLVSLYFTWFMFAEAERDRVKLFGKRDRDHGPGAETGRGPPSH